MYWCAMRAVAARYYFARQLFDRLRDAELMSKTWFFNVYSSIFIIITMMFILVISSRRSLLALRCSGMLSFANRAGCRSLAVRGCDAPSGRTRTPTAGRATSTNGEACFGRCVPIARHRNSRADFDRRRRECLTIGVGANDSSARSARVCQIDDGREEPPTTSRYQLSIVALAKRVLGTPACRNCTGRPPSGATRITPV